MVKTELSFGLARKEKDGKRYLLLDPERSGSDEGDIPVEVGVGISGEAGRDHC